jgi:hypothetical protein
VYVSGVTVNGVDTQSGRLLFGISIEIWGGVYKGVSWSRIRKGKENAFSFSFTCATAQICDSGQRYFDTLSAKEKEPRKSQVREDEIARDSN